MANRILIFDPAGACVMGLDGRHGEDHVAQWLLDTFALLRDRYGVPQAVAIEFDADATDGTVLPAIECTNVRLETRDGPAGREIVNAYFVASRLPNGRAWRVVHSSIPELPATATVGGRVEALDERAARWRSRNPRAWEHRS